MAFRNRRASTLTAPPVRSGLHASAQRQNLKGRKVKLPKPEEWQEEGWGYFDTVGEVKQLTWLQGNVMAKIKLFVAWRDPQNPDAPPIPIDDPECPITPEIARRAQAELNRLQGPLGGKSEICRELNMNLEIAGEGYLIGFAAKDVLDDQGNVVFTTPEEWGIYSISEVRQSGSGRSSEFTILAGPNDQKGRPLDNDTDTIIRIWQRHPRWSMSADCALRGALSELATLVALRNQMVSAARSHMPAGILLLPNDLSTGPVYETEDESGDEALNDPFVQEIVDSIIEPIEDPGAASAYAPLVMRGERESLKEVRHLTFDRADDATLVPRIDNCLMGLARALNSPPEKVLGSDNTTFNNAAVIKQDEFDEHMEPRCVLVTDALTVGFLQPNLLEGTAAVGNQPALPAVAPDIVTQICVWYDAAAMVAQPDLAEKVEWGVQNDVLSLEAGRRIIGATEDDAPDPTEILWKAAIKNRTFDPGVSTAAMELLGVELDIPETLPGQTASAAVDQMLMAALAAHRRGEKPDLATIVTEMVHSTRLTALPAASAVPTVRQARSNPGRHLMSIDRELRTKLLAAASAALTRALERAGNKLKSKSGQTRQLARNVDPLHVARLLGPSLIAAAGLTDDDLIPDDAWDALEEQFFTWGASAQAEAVATVNKIVGLSTAERDSLGLRQAGDLSEAWSWMRDQLHDLAKAKLYDPDPHAPDLGEFDPTSKIPSGLVRQALARAGGASGLTVQGTDPYVVLNNGQPPGGIGTGELVMGALSDKGASVEGYEWVYGPAFRLHPFDPHLDLDGVTFTDFSDDVLSGSILDDDNYFPGDHSGDLCDCVPVILDPAEIDG